ncbi:major capsid protein [Microvirus mar27]|uniref:Major capsid protein n=1 Tax=Microvirus mar27 TaxID=2851160 RepID=A0A8F5XT59_9VIRU|nr:major capsid protein [Microvirus mar27]
MARNSNFSFGSIPKIHVPRRAFNLSYNHKTTLNVGDLVPFHVQEVYPGDTFKIDSSAMVRLTSTFVKPVMDDVFLDTFYFFVPNRLVMDDWKAVMGENNKTAYYTEYESVPLMPITSPSSPSEYVGTIANYMGIPFYSVSSGTRVQPVSIIPFRDYALIYNEWFRDENLQDPVLINKSSTLSSFEKMNSSEFSPNNYTGKVAKINKIHDYFTSALPQPQKGEPVAVSVGGAVTTGAQSVSGAQAYPLRFLTTSGSSVAPGYVGLNSTGAFLSSSSSEVGSYIYPSNLHSEASFSVNDLTYSIALQRMLNRDNYGGTRYIEYIRSAFGVEAPDYLLQRPEFLGGSRQPLNVQQVAQTAPSSTNEDTLADLAAYSVTVGHSHAYKGFVEHGFIIGVCAIRQKHTYQQGFERFWSRSKRVDFYDPIFSNIPMQPIFKDEIYSFGALASPSVSRPVFGYSMPWADLRYKPSRISGALRSGIGENLDVWHFGDWYTAEPFLNSEWIKETPAYVDRTLSVSMSQAPQFLLDIHIRQKAIRALPAYGIMKIGGGL